MNLQAMKQASQAALHEYRITDLWMAHSDNCAPETILKLIAVVEAAKDLDESCMSLALFTALKEVAE